MHACHIRFLVLVGLAGLAGAPTVLGAQFPADVQVGSRVRLWLPELPDQR